MYERATVGNGSTSLQAQIINVCLAMLFSLSRPDNPIETRVTVVVSDRKTSQCGHCGRGLLVQRVDIGLQVPAFAGDLSTDTGLGVLIALTSRQTGNVSGCYKTKEK